MVEPEVEKKRPKAESTDDSIKVLDESTTNISLNDEADVKAKRDDSAQSVKILEQSDSSVKMILHKKKVHHHEPTSPCTLELSSLRLNNDADDSMISESNLSDVQQVVEYDFNADRPTEKILDALDLTGNPADLSLEDKDLEKLLDGDSDTSVNHSSTPISSPRRSDSTLGSVPSLTYSTSPGSDPLIMPNDSRQGALTTPADFMRAAAIMTPNNEAPEESLCALNSDNPDSKDAVKQHFEIGSINLFDECFNSVEFRNSVPASEILDPRRTIAFSQLVVRLILKNILLSYETYLLSYLLSCLMYSRASELNISCYRYNLLME